MLNEKDLIGINSRFSNGNVVNRNSLDYTINLVKRTNNWVKQLANIVRAILIDNIFEDGNKRTARLMANALLLAHGCAPLSYRSMDENEYREAIIVWYELNSVIPFKELFVEQYDFAARNYAVK